MCKRITQKGNAGLNLEAESIAKVLGFGTARSISGLGTDNGKN
jgi:hypothetical protein